VKKGMKSLKDEELEARLQELREEKTRLTDAYVSGRIPKEVYKKTVIKLEKEIGRISEEMKLRIDGKK
jgi:predicted  nucleic acid-binding Zn-ribbon protein